MENGGQATVKLRSKAAPAPEQVSQYLYLCTSKASKVSISLVLVKQVK
jgi:hypothetical protein